MKLTPLQGGRERVSGFALIEVLVSAVVLGIGLLGLAALHTQSMQANHSAYLRSQAVNFTYDIADRMRANRSAALSGEYNIAIDATPSGGTLAGDDLVEWKTALAVSLPSGDGSVARDGDLFSITVQWDDSRGADPAQQFFIETQI
ncbi:MULTISPECIES: type IV pilus modification protein PilV [unclassified Ectothiorhodospira]|jgi:type IV pilus assembly protein PilV|uniref:type IV pilus modification protein PilV n=1 Tax=unclassified Ectothiorhodospira TaxID=2684909 RepID=UPI001EE8755A|nr:MULTISPECIES: type IV pilus modification protein PilV [unclassified Ectothiorhodospira]MCG5517022.1 type IV pilus modification protein PilV [Ectothiorhodospira sp. 9100]MCG5520026.1 type IV pilus modification protein PilV [Ectothiorhodospira sp. 9905]